MYKKLKVALVVPAYNEQKLIRPTLESVPRVIDKVYVINDGSRDNTEKVVKALARKDKRITLINHERNLGLGQSIITGYMRSSKDDYDITVVVGGDHQMDLSEVERFLEPIANKEADFVKGNRFMYGGNAYKDMPRQRFFGNSSLSLLTKFASGYWKIFDSNDGYTAIAKWVIDKVDWSTATKGYGYNGDWMALFNVCNVRIKDVPRKAIYLKGERQSQIKVGRYAMRVGPHLFRRFFWRLKTKYFYYNFHPLLFFYIMSFLLFPLGLVMGIWLIYSKIIGSVITGSTTILAALFILTGLQCFLFAVLFDMQDNEKLQP